MIPHVANKGRRLSKLETLTLAKNYIVALTGMVVTDEDKDELGEVVGCRGEGLLSKDCLLQAAAEAAADEFAFDLDLDMSDDPQDALGFYD